MLRISNHQLSIQQGSEALFAHFDTAGEMWVGKGSRSVEVNVTFPTAYETTPIVQVGLELLDIDKSSNTRFDVSAKDVTPKGFKIVFSTWGDTKIARARANWVSFGEMRHDDDWDV